MEQRFPWGRPNLGDVWLSRRFWQFSLNAHHAFAHLGEFIEHCRIMARDNQPRRSGELFHAVLGAEIGSGIERLCYGDMLFQVFIKIHVVAGQNYRACFGVHAHVLRLERMFAAGIAGMPRKISCESPFTRLTRPARLSLTAASTSSGSIPPWVRGPCHASPV